MECVDLPISRSGEPVTRRIRVLACSLSLALSESIGLPCASQSISAPRTEQTPPPAKSLAVHHVERAAGTLVTCDGRVLEKPYCVEFPQGSAELVRQRSAVGCTEGRNWGTDELGLWVKEGCWADFVLETWVLVKEDELETTRLVECHSTEGKRAVCRVNARGGVVLRLSLGHTECLQGSTWDYDADGIWVDRGCKGVFEVSGAPERASAASEKRECFRAVGTTQASIWEFQCGQVATGKFAPCGVENMCQMITEQIRRGCARSKAGAPKFCKEYERSKRSMSARRH